jgi:glycosyltransferase involved in cell wall biosynthesis
VILFLHNRYRTTGGEERAVEDLMWLVREHLGEAAELLARDSAGLGRSRAAAGMLRGGLDPEEVAAAVRRTGARIVHAHNVNPMLGWRSLAAARAAGARVVLHLHNYRLVCAVGTCFTRGADCTRCHGRNTAPGVRLACRGTRAEAAVYGAGLALWQDRLAEQADAFAVPSEFAARRLRELGAPVGERLRVVGGVVRDWPEPPPGPGSEHVLYAGRLAPEKGVEVVIEACGRAGRRLVVAGDGPERARLEACARAGDVRFAGHVGGAELNRLRATAGLAVVPSRSAETFGLAAAEAMASGLPVVAADSGALGELVGPGGLVEPGDSEALARAIDARFGDAGAGATGRARALSRCAPEAVAKQLTALYAAVDG